MQRFEKAQFPITKSTHKKKICCYLRRPGYEMRDAVELSRMPDAGSKLNLPRSMALIHTIDRFGSGRRLSRKARLRHWLVLLATVLYEEQTVAVVHRWRRCTRAEWLVQQSWPAGWLPSTVLAVNLAVVQVYYATVRGNCH